MPAVFVTPKPINITWDRTGDIPGLPNISLSSLLTGEISVSITYSFDNTPLEWLYCVENNASRISVYLENNITELPNGTYTAYIYFDLQDDSYNTSSGVGIINLTLTGVPPTQVTTDKTNYNVIYNRETAEITGDSLVSILNNPDPILLKFWQNDEVFAAAENFTDGFSLTDNLANPIAANPILPLTGTYQIGSKILKQTGEFVSGFMINLIIVDGGIVVQPENLSFEIFKGSTEKSAVLTVTNPLGLDFEITECPSWLNLSALSGNADASITVTTNTATLAFGIYTENIKFEYNDKFIDVPVTLDLKGFIIIDETKDFCLDLPEVIISKKTAGANFVKIKVTATYTVLGIAQVFEKTYLQAYFKNKVLFGLGEKLHRHFPRIKKHFFDEDETVIMQKINATIKVEELDINRTAVFEQTVSDIKLFPGKKPTAYPILSSAIYRKKNANAILFTSKVDGNHVDLKITDVSDLPSQVSFYDFPKTYAPVHVQWENQNLCPEWFTFTGDYKITPDFNHIYARNIFNAQNEKYDVTKVKTLTINTGLFLSKERALMTEIIESKLSFLKIEGKIYRAFNITKKNVEVDSTEELIARDLEFIIVE